ncbi:hypothetical protein ACN19N_05765 [Acinetobacter sp. LF10]|uniref:hypothetical protein n=1 Tax=Acinetobacter sp. LF10 TaxID=3403576 RepID=UPI003B2259AB
MKFLILLFAVYFIPINSYANDKEEDRLLSNFAEATKARNLPKKCQATKDLLRYYKKVGNKNRVIMSQGILDRDCKKYK